MKQPWVVGLTGGIGSGKTAASDWFAAQGITVVDADVVARQVVEPNQPAWHDIVAHFGPEVLHADDTLNRLALRTRVFADPQARQTLESFTHPRIRTHMLHQLQNATSPYVLLVSPLLLETTQHELVQRVLLVDVPEHIQQARAAQRDGQSTDAIAKIMAAQMPRAERQRRAHDTVMNHQDLNALHAQLQPLHEYYLQQAQHPR